MNLANKPLLIGLAVALVIFLIGVFIYRTPTPSPVSDTVYTPLLTLPLEEMDEKKLETLPSYKEKKSLSTGEIQYLYETPNLARDSVVITDKNGGIVFKKVITTDTDYSHPKISEYKKSYGDPEEVIIGSKKYGPYATYTMYPSKGLVLIGNPLTDEVFEIDLFSPMSSEEYKSTYGEDIETVVEPIKKEEFTPVVE